MAGIFSFIKRKTDKFGGLTSSEKKDIEEVLRARKIELIARKELEALDKKYAVKEKKSWKETMAGIKAYRMENLKRRKERIKMTEDRKARWKKLEENRKKSGGLLK